MTQRKASTLCDFHIHTRNTDDAQDTLEAMAEAAAARGILEIAVTDHFVPGLQGYCVTPHQIERHFTDAERIMRRHGVSVRVGIEADYLPGAVRELEAMIRRFDFDMILGAAHFVDWCGLADEGSARTYFSRHEPRAAYRMYFEHLEESIRSGLFHVMAHLDLVKKFGAAMAGNPGFEEYAECAESVARALAETGTAFELNCRGFDHACAEQYPSAPFLAVIKQAGVETVTIGSDAHRADAVGDHLERGAAALAAAGFTRIARFRQGKPCFSDLRADQSY
jgi:histidinol-phosphatase (PHP family)